MFAWGDNAYGQIGNNRTGGDITTPATVSGMPTAKQVAAGADFSLALMTNGKVYAWGRGIHGQLGTGTRATSSVPRQVVGLGNGQGGGPGGSRSGPSWRPPV
ncbi:hypothetical protein ACIGW7_18600 [Streptomyces sp. NPDC053253]